MNISDRLLNITKKKTSSKIIFYLVKIMLLKLKKLLLLFYKVTAKESNLNIFIKVNVGFINV